MTQETRFIYNVSFGAYVRVYVIARETPRCYFLEQVDAKTSAGGSTYRLLKSEVDKGDKFGRGMFTFDPERALKQLTEGREYHEEQHRKFMARAINGEAVLRDAMT